MGNGFGSSLVLFLSISLLVSLLVCVHGDPACHGSLAECLEGEEFGMNSEISRRILASSQYISYKVLQRNTVPCSQRGASYYNCAPGAAANPYSRSCSAITRCRG